MNYQEFIRSKSQFGAASGFEPIWMPEFLFPFQKFLCDWNIRTGRAESMADCGLGKTPMQLVIAQNVVMKTNERALILTPLAVAQQTVKEAEKFGIEATVSKDGKNFRSKIIVTNYERLHYFNPDDFSLVVCDDGSIMKNFDGQRKAEITEFMRTRPYRHICTATAAPNDYWELGTCSEALGYLGWRDMITKFFKQETEKDYLGWGRTKYRFRGHAEQPFWKWVCSWLRACRKPSDMGFDDAGFVLPQLIEEEILIENTTPRAGYLLPIPASTLPEQREEQRLTLRERCEKAAEIMSSHDRPCVAWCHLNPEADLLERMVKDSRQVSGRMTDEEKEEAFLAFQTGQIKKFIIKPKIGCHGLNWQHCHDTVVFPSHSWEQYYQLVRRFLRFGQKFAVNVSVVTTEGQQAVMSSLKRKSLQADRMFTSVVRHANEAMALDGGFHFDQSERMPRWL